MIEIRAERPDDEAAIREVLLACFPSSAEAEIVEHLREHGAVVVALVAVAAERVVGYVAFSRLWVENGQRLTPAVALAPLAVLEEFRRAGIGGRMIEAGHEQLADLRERLSVVVGDPAYYARFGYRRDAAEGFASAYQCASLLALPLAETAPRQGTLRYDPAFDGL